MQIMFKFNKNSREIVKNTSHTITNYVLVTQSQLSVVV